MFKNIKLSEINKSKVLYSQLLFITVLFIMLLITFLICGLQQEHEEMVAIFTCGIQITFKALIIGFLIAGGLLVFNTLVEYLFIRNSSSDKTVSRLFIVEVILPTLVVGGIFLTSNWWIIYVGGTLLFLTVSQLIRWFYLKSTQNLYNSF